MKVIYATKNESKLASMQMMLEETEVDLISLNQLDFEVEEPIEDGDTPLENAKKKALGYYKQIKEPVYSTDSALYFEGVEDQDQPGVLIKRIHGENLSGTDFQKYYMELAKKYGGKITARYKNAICLVLDENTVFEYDGEDISSETFYIVDTPHEYFENGYPLNSLSIHIESGKYYNDLKDYKSKGNIDEGFRKFFNSILDK